ncbi:Uncharacterised protein [Legionella beliardensis]|uniref:Uncharacterized protein n=1 Tax=Legionella beliardensis TaxID=91822 RepID=A0A378I4R7_9GAMM|nr:hypothetical protein [Legionella beliardensis]STX27504.1 Uncharacterised protein [Legionella beliardensis]
MGQQKFLARLNKRLILTDKARYKREPYQSYMTGPEWGNVELAEDFAKFLRESNSMFQFPYFRRIVDLWGIFKNSYQAARKYNSFWQIATSEYMLMDVFVCFFTTIELLPKGILSLLVRPFLKKENPTEFQTHLAAFFTRYANDLQTIPFYDQNYAKARHDLAKHYQHSPDKSWIDWISFKFVSMELWARHWISKPLHHWFHQETNLVEATTDIVVKFNTPHISSAAATHAFTTKLARLDPSIKADIVNDQIYTKKYKSDYTSVYARLRVSRYSAFKPALHALNEQGIYLRKIAGQDQVQVKCEINTVNERTVKLIQNKLEQIEGVSSVGDYGDRLRRNRRICLFDVPVKNLADKLTEFENIEDVQVKFIHNF